MFNKRIWFTLLVPVVAVVVLGSAVVGQASAPSTTIKLATNATLANPPTSLVVSVDYSCMPSQFSFAGVNVDQSQTIGGASGARIDVFGNGNFNPICDDKSHHADVVVTSNWWWSSGTFTSGPASASAFLYSGAAGASTQSEISIK